MAEPATADRASTPRGVSGRTSRSSLVNTGDGKGKSSSAFGVVIRAVARGWKVAVVQFLKSGEWHVGEEDITTRLGVKSHALGEGFTWDSADLTQDEAVAPRGVEAGPRP